MPMIPENENVENINSPFSRVYLYPETQSIMNCAMGFKNPINIESLKKAFSNSIMLTHPRFSSLIVQKPNGTHQWKKTHVNIDEHFIIHNPTPDSSRLVEVEEEAAVNAYLADLAVSSPLNKNKPLWEVHVLVGLKCIVLRIHHALGDAVSLMSMLSTCFGPKEEMISNGNLNGVKNQNYGKLLGLIMKSLWFTIVFVYRLLARLIWENDEIISIVSGGDGVELWPRKLVTAKFKIQDFKSIKKLVPYATVNDVLTGVISSGLSKFINVNSTKGGKGLMQTPHLTSIVMVNIRQNPCLHIQESPNLMRANSSCEFSSWGNKTGLVLLPISCRNGLSPLDHVKTMKKSMDQKKLSYEAHILYWSLQFLTFFSSGIKVANWCSQRMLCNTTLLISNIMGPSKEIVIAENPVTYLRLNITAQTHAITMHMVSYAGNADLQVMVAKDIVTDPEFLVKCFQESLIELKNSI